MPQLLPRRVLPLCLALLALGGCGDDSSSAHDADTRDAVPTGPCRKFLGPTAIVDTYPASAQGDLLGAGANHSVDSMACAKEETYYSPAGEEQVVRLDGLTPGQAYAVKLEAPADLAFYVTAGCTDGEIAAGDCLLFVDAEPGGTEISDFVAPDAGRAYIVVDHFVAGTAITDGSFTVDVYQRECIVDADCTSDAARPFCHDFQCVPCTSSFHCDAPGKPVCDSDLNVCAAGHSSCTGDDASPPEDADDGPAGALEIVATDGVPGVVNAKICGLPSTGGDLIEHQDAEVDFYKFTIAEGDKRAVSLEWVDTADLDLYLYDSDGTIVDNSFFGATSESLVVDEAAAGTYYLAVAKFEDVESIPAAALAYTLTLSFPECETSFDCPTTQDPVCGPALTCRPGGAICTNDDANEQNDGPSVATPLTSGVPVSGAICNSPAEERDFYSITVAAGDSLEVSLAYIEGDDADLDVTVFAADGALFGTSFWLNPEQVNLTFLPAGTYFIQVSHVGGATALAHAYDLIATVTATGGCVSATNCAAEYSTQIYRGQCELAGANAGACTAIAGAGALTLGAACDSGDDCTSGLCSNLIFQEAAQTSVCTIPCVANTTCTDAHDAGFSCTIPFVTNKCHPDCTGPLECGALTGSQTIDAGEPWDYLVCNAGACELGM